MSELERNSALPFREAEQVDENGYRTRLIDANTPEAEALSPEDFWLSVFGEHRNALGQSLSAELQLYFGEEQSPDELIVALPLHDTNAWSSLKAMYTECYGSMGAMTNLGGLFLQAYDLRPVERDHDTLIGITLEDWASNVSHHNGTIGSIGSTSFSVFRAAKAKLPKDFLRRSGPNLTAEQWQIMQSGLDKNRL